MVTLSHHCNALQIGDTTAIKAQHSFEVVMICLQRRRDESELRDTKKYLKDTSPQLRGGGWLWVQAFLQLLFWSQLILLKISLDLARKLSRSYFTWLNLTWFCSLLTIYHLWPKVLLCARDSQCAGVCGGLQGAWRCFAGHRFNLILFQPGTCLFPGGRREGLLILPILLAILNL